MDIQPRPGTSGAGYFTPPFLKGGWEGFKKVQEKKNQSDIPQFITDSVETTQTQHHPVCWGNRALHAAYVCHTMSPAAD
jgi:hypothetical protein